MATIPPGRELQPVAGVLPRIHDDTSGRDAWADDAPRVLLAGVDTCYFSFDVEVSEEIYLGLMSEQLRARLAQKERNAAYCSEWLNARVAPGGVKGYAVLIEREEWSIKLHRDNPTRPPIYVEMRSLALHTHPQGVLGACEEVCAFIRDVLLADRSEEVRNQVRLGNERLSRLDLHLDYQGGWTPTLEEQEQRLFIKPGHAKLHGHLEGDRCTGYDIGKRRIVGRIYNKSLQAREHHLDWYFALLQQAAGDAYDPDRDVWRIEFELKREGIQGFCLYTKPELDDPDDVIDAELEAEDLPTIGTLPKALHWADHLMGYLMTRWLRLVMPSDDTNRARWPTHPTWLALRAGFAIAMVGAPLDESRAQLVRAHRHTGYGRLLERMGLGIAETAQLLVDSDPGSVLPAYLERIQAMAEKIAERQQAKRNFLGREGARDASRRRHAEAIQHLSEMALGVFTGVGVLKAELPRVGTVADLLCFLVDDLEELAKAKGGIGQLLYDKWCKTYKVAPPKGLFTIDWQSMGRAA